MIRPGGIDISSESTDTAPATSASRARSFCRTHGVLDVRTADRSGDEPSRGLTPAGPSRTRSIATGPRPPGRRAAPAARGGGRSGRDRAARRALGCGSSGGGSSGRSPASSLSPGGVSGRVIVSAYDNHRRSRRSASASSGRSPGSVRIVYPDCTRERPRRRTPPPLTPCEGLTREDMDGAPLHTPKPCRENPPRRGGRPPAETPGGRTSGMSGATGAAGRD